MSNRIVIICNSCPYKGETFLKNELDVIPCNVMVTLIPAFLKGSKRDGLKLNEQVQVDPEAAVPSCMDYLKALFCAILSPFIRGELQAIFNKRQPFRNLTKAIKFAFISECRVFSIARWLRKSNITEIKAFYAYWMYEPVYIVNRLKEKFPDSCTIVRCHRFDLYENLHKNSYVPFRKYILASTDKICSISQDGYDYLNELYHQKWKDKIELYRLGTHDHGVCEEQRGNIFTIVSCSNLVPVKRVDRIIDALIHYRDKLRWIHFGDGSIRSELEEKASTLPENIEWTFFGHISNASLMEFYKANYVDAFLNVSESEGVPVSIMEAMSFGVPIIATDVGGTHEIVLRGENGILLDEDPTSNMICGAISCIANEDENKINKMRIRSREIWVERCSSEKNYRLFYEQLMRDGE